MKRKDLNKLEGETLEEQCNTLGVIVGEQVDIRKLKKISVEYGIDVVLYWEEDLARIADYDNDIRAYRNIPEDSRPFISIEAFLNFLKESYGMFPKSLDELLEDIPIAVEITAILASSAAEPRKNPVIVGLMPFRDEMDA